MEIYQYYEVAAVDEFRECERLSIEIDGKPVLLINIQGEFYAIQDICTHDDNPLGDGEIEGHQIICPRHGAHFDICTGKALTAPAFVDLITYPVRVVNGKIEIGF